MGLGPAQSSLNMAARGGATYCGCASVNPSQLLGLSCSLGPAATELASPPPRLAEVWGEGPRQGAQAQTSTVLGRYLARRPSREPRARSAPSPPRQAVNEAQPATWGASSTWCSGSQSQLSARPASRGHGLHRSRSRRQVKTYELSLPQQVLRGPLAPGPPPASTPCVQRQAEALPRWLGALEMGIPQAWPPPGTRRS